ncbi:hypothetical protein [Uliginosibacterium gangwonense]|uniref:hypothetical protein n=1 Tax=Uliginosibacterium gangwonense TaxID=392736 RepID=UPI0003A80088|nr:hypothetical protein [Uliginosibacterium gangwonense]
MKPAQILLALLAALVVMPTQAADVGVSISVGQPGFYGRIDIGDVPAPQVIYTRPVMIERVPDDRPPIYLRVPPGHAKNWGKHCHAYHACGERVFFVRDDWYQREYVPRHEGHRDGPVMRDDRQFEHREERRDDRRDMRRDERRDDRRGGDQDRRDDRGGRGHGNDRRDDHGR